VLQRELDRISVPGLRLEPGSEIGPQDIARMAETYDAIFLGVGLSASEGLSIPGIELDGVLAALDLLQQACLSAGAGADPVTLDGRHVVVIGGGNVAMDAAYTAATSGADRVTILYRRSLSEMPAWQREFEHASCLGVQFRWLTGVSAIEGRDGRVAGVWIHPLRLGSQGADGRRRPERAAGKETLFPCDCVIVAVGQALDPQWKNVPSLEIASDGTVEVADDDTLRTSHLKIFTGGDAYNGGQTVVQAMAEGMRAARGIDKSLSEKRAT